MPRVVEYFGQSLKAALSRGINMVTFRKSRLRPSTKFEVRRPSCSEDTAHLVCQMSIYNSFPVIRIHNCKKIVIFTYPGLHFVCPGTPLGQSRKRCMNEKTIQCLPNPSLHVPIYPEQFPSYSNLKCQKSPFSRTATHILFPLETPLRLSPKLYHGWKDNSMLAKPLAACTCLYSIVSELGLYDA